MKIRRIRFENINSLKGQHKIDFDEDPLATSGLFAITGPTGSGKTTLLDVICLALYNEVPRIGKISRSIIEATGSILTRHTGQARASVTYECHQGIFTSEWSISVNRNGNLRDYEMSLFDQHEQSLGLKKSLIPAKNAALIGLEYEQFVRSILLAQGDFARFLQSKQQDRAQLLEKITGTSIYRELGMRAFRKARELEIKTSEINQQIEGTREQLLSNEALKQTHDAYALADRSLKKTRSTKDVLKKAIDLKTLLDQLNEKAELAKKALEKAREALVLFDQNEGAALKKHQLMEPLREKLHDWKNTADHKNNFAKDIDSLEKELIIQSTTQKNILDQITNLIQNPVSKKNASESLDTFFEKYMSLKRARKQLRDQFLQIQQSLNQRQLTIQDNQIVTFKEPAAALIQLEESELREKEDLQSIEKKLNQNALKNYNPAKISDLSGLITDIRKEENNLERLKSDQDSNIQKIGRLTKYLKDLPNQIKLQQLLSEKLASETRLIRSDQELKKLRASLEDKRRELVDGKPCPLCGAIHHPWGDEVPSLNFDKELLQKKESERDDAKKKLIQLEEEHKNGLVRIRDMEIDQQNNQKTEALTLSAIKEQRQKLPDEVQGVSIRQVEFARDEFLNLSRLREKKTELLKDIKWATPQVDKLIDIVNAGQEFKTQMEDLYAGGEPLADLKKDLDKQWNDNQSILSNLYHEQKLLNEGYHKTETHLRQQDADLLSPLKKLSYGNPETALKDLLSHEQEVQLTNKYQNLRKLELQSQNDFNNMALQVQEKRQLDIKSTKHQILEELEICQEEINKLTERSKDLYATIEMQKKNDEFIQRKTKEKQSIMGAGEQWLLLKKQIGDASGNKFSTFAQQLTLEQLILLANKRLGGLSTRYLLTPPKDEGDLEVIDLDMGDLRRSVKTLSGGETFLISLSLALALSDLASRNIQIESMFIDEGFGTLDPETLDQTLDVLERLQANDNRIIGIISHIDALKDRISTQIQIVPTGQGYSEVKIIS